MYHKIVFSIVLVLLMNRVTEAILCYQCDSLNYRTCTVQTCSGTRCQTRTSLMNGQVSHMCGVAMGPDGCRDTFGEKICTCSTDKCNNEGINDSQNENGSGRPGQGTSAIILSGLLSVLINKF